MRVRSYAVNDTTTQFTVSISNSQLYAIAQQSRAIDEQDPNYWKPCPTVGDLVYHLLDNPTDSYDAVKALNDRIEEHKQLPQDGQKITYVNPD